MTRPAAKLTLPFLALFFLLSTTTLLADHIVGGDIAYKWVSGNKYEITYTFYRDCAGIPVGSTLYMNVHNSCKKTDTSIELHQVGPKVNISPLCKRYIDSTTCNNGRFPGVEQYVFRDTVDLKDTCKDWVFSFNSCCRNVRITNLQNPSGTSARVEAHLDNTSATGHVCNSPVFNVIPVDYIQINDTTALDFSAKDPDGDSLVYELIPAKQTATTNVVFAAGYTFNQPFKDNFDRFDPSTGIYTVAPTTIQVVVMAVIVKKYRHGKLVGSVERDLQVIVLPGHNHKPEILPNLNSTYNFNNKTHELDITVCAGETLTLPFEAYDADAGQIVTIKFDSIYGCTHKDFDTLGHQYLKVIYHPDSTQVSSLPHNTYIYLTDNNCPVQGHQTYIIKFNVHRKSILKLGFTDTTVCPGTPVRLIAKNRTNYKWTPGGKLLNNDSIDEPVARVYTTTTFTVFSARHDTTCSAEARVTINTLPAPKVFAGDPYTIHSGEAHTIEDNTITGSYFSYAWYPGNFMNDSTLFNPTVNPPYSRWYYLKATNYLGCSTIDSVFIKFDANGYIFVPNAFTPNGDGLNDYLSVKKENIQTFHMEIFNRWGQIVFETTDVHKEWDGRSDNTPEPVGTYVYFIQATDIGGHPVYKKGSISLLR